MGELEDIREIYEIEADGAVVLYLFVQPGASRTAVVGRHGDALKVKVSAPPEAGKANEAVTRLLAGELGLAHRDVELVRGAASRSKICRLRNLDRKTFEGWLESF